MQITEAQRMNFRTEGYFILENVIPSAQVEGLREECQRYIDRYDAEMEAKGVTYKELTTTRNAISLAGGPGKPDHHRFSFR